MSCLFQCSFLITILKLVLMLDLILILKSENDVVLLFFPFSFVLNVRSNTAVTFCGTGTIRSLQYISCGRFARFPLFPLFSLFFFSFLFLFVLLNCSVGQGQSLTLIFFLKLNCRLGRKRLKRKKETKRKKEIKEKKRKKENNEDTYSVYYRIDYKSRGSRNQETCR